jgi:hypothetical protein
MIFIHLIYFARSRYIVKIKTNTNCMLKLQTHTLPNLRPTVTEEYLMTKDTSSQYVLKVRNYFLLAIFMFFAVYFLLM